MLTIVIPKLESWDSKNNRFIYEDAVTLELEHSLVALSKWESKWEKPFLAPDPEKNPKSTEETIDYIRCMTLTDNVPPEIYYRLESEQIDAVNNYIDAKMSATWFTEPGSVKKPPSRSRETVTAEIIYHWMIALNINWETQHWHLNRLFTLIKVCNQKNAPEKKRGQRDMVAERQKINAERKAAMQTRG